VIDVAVRSVEAVAAWAGPVFLQAAVLAAAVIVIDRALLRRRGGPALRMALWSPVALRLLLPADLHSPWSVTAGLLPTTTTMAVTDGSALEAAVASGPAAWVVALVCAWAAGCIVLAIGALRAAAAERRRLLAHESLRPIPTTVARAAAEAAALLRMRRIPQVVVSTAVDSPTVLGVLRPIVIFPADCLLADSRRDARHALLHEFAHLTRRDPLDRVAASAVRLLWWWNPVAWAVAARLDALREACCDATVARVLGAGVESYRATLLRVARSALAPSAVAVSPGLRFAGPAMLLRERLSFLDVDQRFGGGRVLPALTAALLLLCVVPMARTSPVPASTERNAPALAALRTTTGDRAATADDSGALPQTLPGPGTRRAGCFEYRFEIMRKAVASGAVASVSTSELASGSREPAAR
jgi:beta-lactamase regulating signal transducer with metallopeptidase domain